MESNSANISTKQSCCESNLSVKMKLIIHISFTKPNVTRHFKRNLRVGQSHNLGGGGGKTFALKCDFKIIIFIFTQHIINFHYIYQSASHNEKYTCIGKIAKEHNLRKFLLFRRSILIHFLDEENLIIHNIFFGSFRMPTKLI